ncbi:unnamed protein product [Urochloa humidicola]
MPALVVAHGGTGGRRADGASAPHGLTLDHCSTNHRLAPALSLLCLLLSSAVSLGLARSPFCGSTLSLAAYKLILLSLLLSSIFVNCLFVVGVKVPVDLLTDGSANPFQWFPMSTLVAVVLDLLLVVDVVLYVTDLCNETLRI